LEVEDLMRKGERADGIVNDLRAWYMEVVEPKIEPKTEPKIETYEKSKPTVSNGDEDEEIKGNEIVDLLLVPNLSRHVTALTRGLSDLESDLTQFRQRVEVREKEAEKRVEEAEILQSRALSSQHRLEDS